MVIFKLYLMLVARLVGLLFMISLGFHFLSSMLSTIVFFLVSLRLNYYFFSLSSRNLFCYFLFCLRLTPIISGFVYLVNLFLGVGFIGFYKLRIFFIVVHLFLYFITLMLRESANKYVSMLFTIFYFIIFLIWFGLFLASYGLSLSLIFMCFYSPLLMLGRGLVDLVELLLAPFLLDPALPASGAIPNFGAGVGGHNTVPPRVGYFSSF